jgi:hypothetical protein
MPCYDGRDTGERVSDAVESARREFRHNSDVAELLCAQCRALEQLGHKDLIHRAVLAWWEEHKERDRKKAERERKDKEYNRLYKEWKAKEPKR